MKIIYNIKKFIRHIKWTNKFSKDTQRLLDIQYDKIYKHKKKIKKINKYCKKYDPYGFQKQYLHAIKNHRYLINKAYKEIDGIKKYYYKR
jgi:hypothetical protein